MKPILVAIIAASIFLIPFNNEHSGSLPAKKDMTILRQLPVEKITIDTIKGTLKNRLYTTSDWHFLHGGLILFDL